MFSLCRMMLLTGVVVNIARARLATEKRGAGRLRSGAPPPSKEDLREEVRHALSSALGDGHGVEQSHLDSVHHRLLHTWVSLPKNSFGLVARRSMRYAVHRYFLQRYHLSIIGLEPASEGGSNTEAALLMNFVPRYVRNVLEGKDDTSGFSLADAVALIAVLEHIVVDSGAALLATVYKVYKVDQRALLPANKVTKIAKVFLAFWTTGELDELDDHDSNEDLMDTQERLVASVSEQIAMLAEGAVEGFMFERQGEPRRYFRERGSGGAWHPLSPEFSFTDVQTIVSSVIHTFGQFWAPECERMKHALVDIDMKQTGRVELSDFHTAPTGGPWDFSESADYLRQLGALDETSGWRGARVIVTNYLQATTNCVIRAAHYRVCCANECEEHMDALETIVGAPDATPELLLSAIENISAAQYGDEDFVDEFEYDEGEDEYYEHNEPSVGNRKPGLPSSLKQQLLDISVSQGGKVPLHGRLFAQWLHYAFPHECSYPHKSGTIKAMTPEEYGGSYRATNEEIETHIQNREDLHDRFYDEVGYELGSHENDSEFMSQWDHEEELLAEHVGLKAPWEKSQQTIWFVLALMGLFFAAMFSGIFAATQKTDGRSLALYC